MKVEGPAKGSTAVEGGLPHDETIAAVWPVAGDRRRPKRGHHPVFQVLRWGFVSLAVLCLLFLLALGGVAWKWPDLAGSAYLALLNVNILLGGLAAIYVARRLVVLFLDRRGRLRGGRLHVRVLGIFAILAVLPAVGVGGVSIYLLNQGIEGWFAAKVSAALEGGKQVAEGYLEESQRGLLGEVSALGRDPIWQLPVLLERATVSGWLRQNVIDKRMDDLALVDGDGMVMASGNSFSAGSVPSEVVNMMQGPMLGPQVNLMNGHRMVAVVPLKNGWWLVGQREMHAEMLERIEDNAAAYKGYLSLRENRDHIRILASWFLIVLLAGTVTLAVWTAIRLANKIVRPVTELVHGTNRVSAGDFTVRLLPRDDDELGVLTQAFNRMTLQLASGRDLVERKNRELDERRRFMEAVLTGVTAGVVAVDDAGIVKVANQSAFLMLGIKVGDKLSREVPELSEMVREVNRAIHEGTRYGTRELTQREVKVTPAEGDTRTLLVRLVPQVGHMYADGAHGGGMVLTFDDITPLIGAQRLAAWQDVARRLAHEIKNPLTPIQLSAERLKRKYLAQMPESDKQLFAQLTDTIVTQSEEMRRMTNEFSDFARMPQARMEPENMVALIDDVVALQRARGGVKFETEYEVAVAPVNVDKGQVVRVLTNLMENAVNAINERPEAVAGGGAEVGSTKVPQGEVRIVVKKPQAAILAVEIHDNGRGLPGDVAVEQLFDPYVTTRKNGTGLGLAIVKKVMDEHGGTVRLLRRKEGGTTVALTFPLTGEPIANAQPAKKTKVRGAKATPTNESQETKPDEHDAKPTEKRNARNSGGGRRGRNSDRAGRNSGR